MTSDNLQLPHITSNFLSVAMVIMVATVMMVMVVMVVMVVRTGQDRIGKHAVCPIFGQAIFICRQSFNLEQLPL